MCVDINGCSEMWHTFLQQPLKQQTLRTISIFSRLLYDVCELQNSLNEMLLSTTQFVPSFIYDLDVSYICVWLFGYQDFKVCLAIVLYFLVFGLRFCEKNSDIRQGLCQIVHLDFSFLILVLFVWLVIWNVHKIISIRFNFGVL